MCVYSVTLLCALLCSVDHILVITALADKCFKRLICFGVAEEDATARADGHEGVVVAPAQGGVVSPGHGGTTGRYGKWMISTDRLL